MNILIVGAPGHNGSRWKQFHKRGCKLTYLSTFYFVESLWDFQDGTLRYEHFRDEDELWEGDNFETRVYGILKKDEIDIVYCLLNFMDGSNEFCKRLIEMDLHVPIVRHYKEHRCQYDELEKEILLETDGQIYENAESYRYFKERYGVGENYLIALGDPPQYVTYVPDEMPDRLSERDGQIHVASFSSSNQCREGGGDDNRYAIEEITEVMIDAGIHVHLFGNIPEPCVPIYKALEARYPKFLHVEGFVNAKTSCGNSAAYDWGLVYSHSQRIWNRLEKERWHFNRLNSPGKMARYIAAGVPFFVKRGIYDFMERTLMENGFGFVFDDYDDLIINLKDRHRWHYYRMNLSLYKDRFSMEARADKILNFLRLQVNGSRGAKP